MKLRFHLFLFGFLASGLALAPAANPVVVFNTSQGVMNVELFPGDSPQTVANFLHYVDTGAYNYSIIHRSVSHFVIQGGGYYLPGDMLPLSSITTFAPVIGEHVLSNTRGTLAMALTTGPDTGTDEWFFNEVDNSALLDGTTDDGPFTAFGQLTDSASLAVMDKIGALPVYNAGSPFDSIPLANYNSANDVAVQNLVVVTSITRAPQNFSTWQGAYFTTAQIDNPAISGPAVSFQNDGVPNLLKYFADIDPTHPMTAAERAELPAFTTTVTGGTQYLNLAYRQIAGLSGVTATVQTSTDLVNWTPAANATITETGTDLSTGDPIMMAQVAVTAPNGREFIRLNLTQ